jgi:hypothetical protein
MENHVASGKPGPAGKRPNPFRWFPIFLFAFAAHATGAETSLLERAISTTDLKSGELLIASAQNAGQETADLVTGIVRHNLAISDPDRWAGEAVAFLEHFSRSVDPIAMAYYGSALTLKAGLLAKKGDSVGASAAIAEGFKKMDAAVRAAPDMASLRFLRAENALSVSERSPFKRLEVAEADYAALEKAVSAGKAVLDPAGKARIEVGRARVALGFGETEEAIRGLESAIRIAPQSDAAVLARKLLADFEE